MNSKERHPTAPSFPRIEPKWKRSSIVGIGLGTLWHTKNPLTALQVSAFKHRSYNLIEGARWQGKESCLQTVGSGSYLVAGDSMAEGVGCRVATNTIWGRLHQQDPTARLELLGRSGWRLQQFIDFIDGIHGDLPQFDRAIGILGANSIVDPRVSIAQLKTQFRRTLETLRKIANEVVFLTGGPIHAVPAFQARGMQCIYENVRARVQEVGQHLPGICEEFEVGLADSTIAEEMLRNRRIMAEDGFHPGPHVYEKAFEGLMQTAEEQHGSWTDVLPVD